MQRQYANGNIPASRSLQFRGTFTTYLSLPSLASVNPVTDDFTGTSNGLVIGAIRNISPYSYILGTGNFINQRFRAVITFIFPSVFTIAFNSLPPNTPIYSVGFNIGVWSSTTSNTVDLPAGRTITVTMTDLDLVTKTVVITSAPSSLSAFVGFRSTSPIVAASLTTNQNTLAPIIDNVVLGTEIEVGTE